MRKPYLSYFVRFKRSQKFTVPAIGSGYRRRTREKVLLNGEAPWFTSVSPDPLLVVGLGWEGDKFVVHVS